MLFGTGERFHYLECADCGSLELLDVPTTLSPYYPSDYYSLAPASAPQGQTARGPQAANADGTSLARIRARRIRSPGAAMGCVVPRPRGPTSILVVGCGSGRTLFNLWQEGLSGLTGHDPHLDESCDNDEVRLIKPDPARA
jgi:hypothetical protein